jgi:YD repeat-containing protein
MNDRAKVGLRGPVNVCRTDTTMFIRGCAGNQCDTEPKEQSHSWIFHYRPDGRIAQQRCHNPDGSDWTSIYTYDRSDRLREIEHRDAKASVSKTIFQYDQAGRLQRVATVAADGTESTAETYSYDGQQKRKTRYIFSTPERPGSVAYSVEGSDAAVSVPGAVSMTTVYDRYDRPVETLFHDSQNRALSRFALRYDDAGWLVEETQTSEIEQTLPSDMLAMLNPAQIETVKASFGFGEGRQRWQQLHRYDNEGHRVETISRMGTFDNERKKITYNQYGDVSETQSTRDSKEIGIDDEGRVVEPAEPRRAHNSEARYSYQYDEHANWIERVISFRQEPDKPFTVSSLVRRTLTYYPAV